MLQVVVRVKPVYMLEGAYEGWTGDAPGCSLTVLPWCHLQTETESTKEGGIRGRESQQRKKRVQVEKEGPTWTGSLPW